MEAVARLNNCPTGPRKMRLVADTIRGRNVEHALNILKFSNKEAAKKLEKLLVSAIYNWESRNEGYRYDESGLYIKEIFVDSGRMLKRFQPAPMGRAHRIRKRSNHVTVIIDSKVVVTEEIKPVKEAEQIEEPAEIQEVEQVETVEKEKVKAKAKGNKEVKEAKGKNKNS